MITLELPPIFAYSNSSFVLTVPKQVLKPLRHHNHRKHQKQKPYEVTDDKHRNIPPSHEHSSHNKTLPHTTPAPEKPSAGMYSCKNSTNGQTDKVILPKIFCLTIY